MSEEEMALARRANDLFIAGDLDGTFGLWSEDCIGIPPRDWPERGPWHGPGELRAAFESWDVAFGADWTRHLAVREMTDLGEGRILSVYEFNASGIESGIPVDQELAAIFTVGNGKLVKGEYFMTHAEAREAAGLE
jgi:ketosteroid isomerase-like protein